MRVLVLNPGSATLKATVLDPPEREPRFERNVDWSADASDAERESVVADVLAASAEAGVAATSIEAVGYRVVHGGSRFTDAVLVTDEVGAEIDAMAHLAPLHNPLAGSTIRAARRALPAIPHVAAFDTAFHASLPEAGYRYPVPERWHREWGVRRYGFHGLSVAWSLRRAGELLDTPANGLRLLVAHLGGGCSVTAVDGGRSVDTSMGMTPLEGLMMGTRSGSIDPGVIFRAIRGGTPVDEVADDLEHRSGLLGVSGSSADMRELLAAEANGNAAAALALELFVRRAAAGIAATATALPAIDGLVFTGGIGEHAGAIRSRIVGRLALLGFGALADDGGSDDAVISGTMPAILRVRAREDVVIAETAATLAGSPG